MRETDSVTNRSVAVCICTYKRPIVLSLLLDRLSEVVANVCDATISVVVVDDDPSASAREACQAAADRHDLDVHYRMVGSGNISTARNAAIEEGSRVAQWLAFIDDDCLPGPAWISELLDVQQACRAECVSGACIDSYPPNTPKWLLDEPFSDAPSALTNGQPVEMGYLKNTLISVDFLHRHHLRFDERFGGTGGEDAMFFYAASNLGVNHRHAAGAIVSEQVPAERVTLSYQLRRRFWYGNTEALTSIASGRAAPTRMAASGVKKLLSGLARPLARLARRQTPQLRFALSEVLRGLGRLVGSVGVRVRHR